ncbi:MAG: hypothetical protein PUC62_00635, partial [Oscillospiraceae bacterium]|nr:hypothetical protein [Oscillospiraceae bacterium]
ARNSFLCVRTFANSSLNADIVICLSMRKLYHIFRNSAQIFFVRFCLKSNWTLEELRWNICTAGSLTEWDGLTGKFIQLVEAAPDILSDAYIRRWYNVSKRSLYVPTPAAEKSFYCPLYNGKITQYDCDELCCGVKTGYLPNDGLPHLMELSDIRRKRESCIKCSRNET